MNPPPLPDPQKKPVGLTIFLWLVVPLLVVLAGAVMTGIFFGVGRIIKSQQVTEDLRSTVQDVQSDTKKSYSPQTGITNLNINGLDRVRDKLDSASQTLSGDDALVAKAMSEYLGTMETTAKKYEAAVDDLRATKVLSLETLSDKSQIAGRRQMVQHFLDVNQEFENVVSNSPAIVRADLNALNVSPFKADDALRGFEAKSTPRTPLVLKIRECDDRMGQAMLGILDLLEQNWGKRNYDPVLNQVQFDDPAAQISYRKFLNAIQFAQREQILVQGQLVALQ